MAEKKKVFIIGIAGIVTCLLVLVLLLPLLSEVFYILPNTNDRPAHPEITYDEFPIRIEYRVNSETIVIEDVLVCNYEGSEKKTWLEKVNVSSGFYRRIWKGELQNHKEGIILLSDGEITIDFSPGSASYYMGDSSEDAHSFFYPSFRVFANHSNEQVFQKFLNSAEELALYGIEIIDWELPKPINNSFNQSNQ